MKILYIYRCPKMGYSIGNVFKPIENKMREKCECDNITFTKPNYKPLTLIENIIRVRRYIKKNPDVIIHITGTENYLLPFIKKYKTIVTVHDLGFYTEQRKNIKTYLKYILWIKTLKLAQKVTFISKKSFLEAKKLIDLEEDKTCIIMNPVNENFKTSLNINFNIEKPLILHIGTKPNKNLDRLIEAIKDINCHLRIIGKLDNRQVDLLERYKIDFSQDQNISNNQMIEEYKNCDIVCFASLYEGFGMPIIEGQAMGKPVVTSNISPMKDIANGSCVLVDPYNVKSIQNGIKKSIKEHKKYIELGRLNAKRFSLDSKTNEYFTLYKILENMKS